MCKLYGSLTLNITKKTTTSTDTTYQKARVSPTYGYDVNINNDNNNSSIIDSYIKNINIMSKGTSDEYLTRLNSFNAFIKNELGNGLNVNDLVTKIKQGELDPYDILSRYSGYLQSSYKITTLTLKQRVVTVKNFF